MNIKRIIAQRDDMASGSEPATLEYLPILFGRPIFEDNQLLVYAVPPAAKSKLPAWQLIPDQKNWTVIQAGAALRMEEKGNLYIYAAQAGRVGLEFQLAEQFSAAGLGLSLNDIPIEPGINDETNGRRVFHLPLKAGFNYVRLYTEPAQQIEVERIAVVDSNL